VRGTNRVHETGAGSEQGMIRQVDGSGAGQPGNDAAAAVRDREPGDRRATAAAVGERAPGNWGDDVGRLGSDPVGNRGGRASHVGSAAPGNRGGCAGKRNRPPERKL
jgi:hypothetical protein